MTYDYQEIAKRVNKKRKKFLISLSIVIMLMIAALVLIILNLNDVVTFACIALEFILLFVIYYITDTQSPKVIFSKEIKGINIKEDEYVSRRPPKTGMRWRQVGGPASPQPFAPNTRANKKKVHPNLRSKVYLQLENGNVAVLSDLYKIHTDIFVEGDTLLKFAGTKYPIVFDRDVERQPCPICGEVNDISNDSCKSCGLGIVKK